MFSTNSYVDSEHLYVVRYLHKNLNSQVSNLSVDENLASFLAVKCNKSQQKNTPWIIRKPIVTANNMF